MWMFITLDNKMKSLLMHAAFTAPFTMLYTLRLWISSKLSSLQLNMKCCIAKRSNHPSKATKQVIYGFRLKLYRWQTLIQMNGKAQKRWLLNMRVFSSPTLMRTIRSLVCYPEEEVARIQFKKRCRMLLISN